jgi:IclR family transcriptional regulator, acetate operon repressor
MSGVLGRTLGVLEVLTQQPEGLPLRMIAERLNIPTSAAHRLLTDLIAHGYVRQLRDQGDYGLTPKLVGMVIDYMGATGIVDFAQPILDRLAQTAGDFIRLAVVDDEGLIWVARSQGARRGLRYDPDNVARAQLSCTASGHAWLMTMSDDDALAHVTRQGFATPQEFGPHAPMTTKKLLACLAEARRRGYAITTDMFGPGLASMAAPVRRPDEETVGVLSIAGPAVRLTPQRMKVLSGSLLDAARELARASATSPLFGSRRMTADEEERQPTQHRVRPHLKSVVGA